MRSGQNKYWELIVWVVNHEATPEQEYELKEWCEKSEENRIFYEKSRKIIEATRKNTSIPTFNTNQAWSKDNHEITQRAIRKRNRLHAFIRYASAAAAIFILTFGIVYFSGDRVSEIKCVADIQPGSPKATLILEDGSAIDINSQPINISHSGAKIHNDSLQGLSLSSDNTEESKQQVRYSTLIIPQGGEYKITLQDGTVIWLNSGSELRFPSCFPGNRREVELKGEAYFQVAHNASKPFFVKTTGATVKVYGTAFNIHAYEDEDIMATTLVKGSVSITPNNGEETLIHPCEQLSYSKKGKTSEVRTVDINLYTSWINGIYSFENATLEDIMNYIRRWYDFEVSYENEQVRDMRFTGEFQKDRPLNYGLDLIKLTCEIKYKVNGKNIIITQ